MSTRRDAADIYLVHTAQVALAYPFTDDAPCVALDLGDDEGNHVVYGFTVSAAREIAAQLTREAQRLESGPLV
jgi:hypothetical protein